MLPPLRALVMFEAVARLGAIGAAARELDVSQAAVSQQLKTLETFLGSQLFDRSQRGVTLTPSAQHYLPVVRGVLQHLIAQTQILFGEQQDAVLRLKVNHSIAYNWLMPRLADFTNRYPFIRLDMTLVDWPSPVPCLDADVEITNGFHASEHTRAERLFQEYWILVCSPDFRQRHAAALAERSLGALPAIQVKGYEETWLQWLSYQHLVPVYPQVQLEISTSLHALEAARQGIGLLLVRSLHAEAYLTSGDLVAALPGSMPAESAHYLITTPQRSPTVNFFCDWLHHLLPDR